MSNRICKAAMSCVLGNVTVDGRAERLNDGNIVIETCSAIAAVLAAKSKFRRLRLILSYLRRGLYCVGSSRTWLLGAVRLI